MTCIVGLIDKESDCVWLGGDTLGSNGYTKTTQSISKVFRSEYFNNVLMGGTTTFRHLDLLQYSKELFSELDAYKGTSVDHKYMVTTFIPQVIKLFKEGIIHEEEKNRGGNFLVAAKNKLFEVQTDFSVLEPSSGFHAVGSGEDAAMASLITTEEFEISAVDRIILALKAAEKLCCGVQRPFHILNTKNNDIIKWE